MSPRRALPSEILALTFTNKAANEMQARVDGLVPYGFADTSISTFHAFGDRLIREFAYEAGRSPDARVLTRAETIVFLRERVFELGLGGGRPPGRGPGRYRRRGRGARDGEAADRARPGLRALHDPPRRARRDRFRRPGRPRAPAPPGGGGGSLGRPVPP